MNIFHFKFRFSTAEHPYHPKIVKLAIYKDWSNGFDLHYCEKFFYFFFLICCRTHKLYDAFSQKMSIWASTVTFLSMVISKRTILYFEKIQGVLKTEFEKELQFKLWLAISKTPKDSHEVSVDGSFKALSKYSKFAFLSQTFFYWNVLENYSFLYNCSAGMGEGVGRT